MMNSTKHNKRNFLLPRAATSSGVGQLTFDQRGLLGIPLNGTEQEVNMMKKKDKDLEGLPVGQQKKQQLADCCVFCCVFLGCCMRNS